MKTDWVQIIFLGVINEKLVKHGYPIVMSRKNKRSHSQFDSFRAPF